MAKKSLAFSLRKMWQPETNKELMHKMGSRVQQGSEVRWYKRESRTAAVKGSPGKSRPLFVVAVGLFLREETLEWEEEGLIIKKPE